MASNLLTDTKIKGLKPKPSAYYVWHASATRGTGRLGVKVYPSGRRVFVYRYFVGGKAKFERLGDYPQVSLSVAQDRARIAQDSVHNGSAMVFSHATVVELFADYIANQQAQGKRAWKVSERRLNNVIKERHFDKRTLAKDITPHHIRIVLSDMLKRGAVGGASKLRSVLHAVFNFGLHADNDPMSIDKPQRYGMAINPVSVVPDQPGSSRALDRFLSWDEIAKVLAIVRSGESQLKPDLERLLLICLYTGGQRPWEIIRNYRKHVSERDRTLSVPPEISKSGNWHVVPLSDTAWELIDKQLRSHRSEWLFPSPKDGTQRHTNNFSAAIAKFCKNHDITPFTPRDIRRTFKTLAGDMGLSIELRDRIQNHKLTGVSSKHYDRYDYIRERRQGLELWEEKLNRL
ncbi:Prophage CP4-57 integrase [Serratia quinivorans]|uniref:tyrosine-type recombinase/integrase n=1 Tax=Serratia quinivorans TaxID=137545 RepID=UPI00217A9124|nr:site-specific integrase [Serratia quinivorans]CAI1771532.1 Prophage CP4-57 integrase [Serratia quinivorans]